MLPAARQPLASRRLQPAGGAACSLPAPAQPSERLTPRAPQVTGPQNRMSPLKGAWMELYTPVTENMKVDMRMNLKTKKVGRQEGAGERSRAQPSRLAAPLASLRGSPAVPRRPSRWS